MFYVTRCVVSNRKVTRKAIAGYKYRRTASDVADFMNGKERQATTYYQVYARYSPGYLQKAASHLEI